MVDQASYKITDVSATYNSCTVTVTTKNIDFYSLPGTIYDESNPRLPMNSSLWTSIKNSISSLLGGISQTSIEKIDISEELEKLVQRTKEKQAQREKLREKFVFGIKDGKWALISFDERLIYGYYGLRPLQ